jgi:UDP-N-acetylmuramyl pentapeptide phosphotransferase/UDP-N-acetylglucosamine-1-phosphate transferase
MKKTMKDELIIFGITFVVLFVSQRLFNCFVYKTDGISVLFGVILMGIAFSLRLFLDDWVITRKLKRELRKLEKELEELKKKYEV